MALLLMAASCEKRVVETDFTPKETTAMVPVTLTGSIPATRATLDGATPKWTAGDRLAVFTTGGTLCPAFTADQGGSATTTFSGSKPDGSTLGFAIYPYSASITVSGGNYTLNLPATQDGTLGSAVMAATVPAEGGMVFSNLLTLVRVTVPAGMRLRRIELQRGDRVCGAFTLSGSTLAVTPAPSPTDADKRVVVEKSAGFSGEDVLLCVLPSASKQIDLVLTRDDGKTALVSKTLQTAYEPGHLKKATIPSSLTFSDLARIGAETATQQYSSATQPSRPQITNGDFETWTFAGKNLPNNWNSFQTADGPYSGMAYDSSDRQVERSTDKRPGSSGSYSCSIWSRKVWGVVAQGNITTGRIHAGAMSASGAGNYNYTERNWRTDSSYPTSNPCAMPLAGRPDSLVYWVKFAPVKNTNNANYEARVAAYLHNDSDFRITAAGTEPVGTRIGLALKDFRTTNSAWVRHAVKFNYSSSATPSYVLLNVSTNKTPGGGATGDYLYIDDIELIYPDSFNVRTDGNGWATMYVDFNALVPSGSTAYYVRQVSGSFAELVPIPAGSVIPKHTGVLVKGSADTQYTFEGSQAAPATVTGNLLSGTTTAISRPSGTCRVLSPESTAGMAVFGAFTGSQLAANTAWLTQ